MVDDSSADKRLAEEEVRGSGYQAGRSLKKAAATSEPPRGQVSWEFLYLLERIDRLDERRNAHIDRLSTMLGGRTKAGSWKSDEKLSGETLRLGDKTAAACDRLAERLGNKIDSINFLMAAARSFG